MPSKEGMQVVRVTFDDAVGERKSKWVPKEEGPKLARVGTHVHATPPGPRPPDTASGLGYVTWPPKNSPTSAAKRLSKMNA